MWAMALLSAASAVLRRGPGHTTNEAITEGATPERHRGGVWVAQTSLSDGVCRDKKETPFSNRAPSPASPCFQPTTTLFVEASLPVPPTLRAHPLTEPESIAIVISARDPTVSLALDVALKTGKPLFPGILGGVPGPPGECLQPAATLFLRLDRSNFRLSVRRPHPGGRRPGGTDRRIGRRQRQRPGLGPGWRSGSRPESRVDTPDNSCPAAPCFVVNPAGTIMATDESDGTVDLVDLRSLEWYATLPAAKPDRQRRGLHPQRRSDHRGRRREHNLLGYPDPGRHPEAPRGRSRELPRRQPGRDAARAPDASGRLVRHGRRRDRPRYRVQRALVLGARRQRRRRLQPRRPGTGRPRLLLPGSTVELWDAASGQRLPGPDINGQLQSIAFSPASAVLRDRHRRRQPVSLGRGTRKPDRRRRSRWPPPT